MKIVYVHVRSNDDPAALRSRDAHGLPEVSLKRPPTSPAFPPSEGSSKDFVLGRSSSKNIIRGVATWRRGVTCEEWAFRGGKLQDSVPGGLPVKLFPCDENLTSVDLTNYIQATGQPDILWVGGHAYPPYLRQIFTLCPDSFKIVYSKNWQPWSIKELGQYDLCLVDEAWQAERVRHDHPPVQCFVWDKLIDYETTFYPIPCEKAYDICYTAYLSARKNHELLFRAMAAVKRHRELTCMCLGGERTNARAGLERMVADLKLSVQFIGEVPYREVNRYINRCKIGVICSKKDAAPRALLEYMAADVPVLVNSELSAGARYVGAKAGLVRAPEAFHHGIMELLANYRRYAPRAHYLEHFSSEKVVPRFIGILEQAGYGRTAVGTGAARRPDSAR